MIQLGGLDSKQTGYDIKKKKVYISFLCIQCTLMKNNDLGMGRKEKGTLWGRAVLGLAPLKEPLSVSKRGT